MPIETPIGQVNRKTGKLWAGENYGEQSEESYYKLHAAGKLNPAQQAIDRATSSVVTAATKDPVIGPALNFLSGAVNTLVDLTPQPIQQAANWVLEKNQEAAENIAGATGLPVSLTDPTTIADIATGGAALAAKPALKTAVKETVQGIKSIDRGGPPGPALATAGANLPQLKPDFNGAYVNLTPQVMEARAKGMSAAIYNKARDFIEKGLVDANYLNRLAEKFKKITGADTGDLQSGILPMRKPYHDAMHDEMRLQPSDTFPGERMEIMKETLTTKLNNVTKLKDFEILVDNLIKNDIKPLVDNAKLGEYG
jgi:hypothetical protein